MSRTNAEEKPRTSETFQVGDFSFSLASGELRDPSGAVVHLRRQSADVLAHLLSRRGEIVTKDELFGTVWSGSTVTDDSLVQCISEIRRSLGDRDRSLVQTVARKGYRIHASPLSSEVVAPPALPARPSIAVLAFEDYSAADEAGFLSDAIAEGIIAEISKFPELFVIARNSSFHFRGTSTPVGEISRRLGVRYLLEGSQQKAGDRLRVTVQLIDAVAGHHLWSETYQRDLDDLFEVQDDIVRGIVAAVAQKVITFEGRGAAAAGGARAAILHHLEARQHLVRFTREANEKARQANLAAIEADPTQPYGYAGLAFVHINQHRLGGADLDADAALAEARRAAQKAVDLAPDYYDGHAAMAFVHLHENDLDRAILRARRARALNPNDTYIMCDLADLLGFAGDLDEAEALLLGAMRLDPLHPDWIRWTLAWVQWLGGKCDEALRTMDLMLEIPPLANRVLAIIHVCLGEEEAARKAIDRLLEFDPDHSVAKVGAYYRGKFRNEADFTRMVESLRKAGLPD